MGVPITKFLSADYVAFDVETQSLDDPEIVVFGIAGKFGKNMLVDSYDARISENMKVMRKIVTKKRIICHNTKFELFVLKANGVDVDKLDFEDTMIMAYLLGHAGRGKLGLKVRAEDVGEKYAEDETWDQSKGNMKKLMRYNMKDARTTLKLYDHYLPLLKEAELLDVYRLEKLVILPCMLMEMYGIKFDSDKCREYAQIAEKELKKIERTMSKRRGSELSLTSPKQMASFIIDTLKVKPQPDWYTKTGKLSTSAEAIENMKARMTGDSKKFLDMYARHKEISKIHGTYLIPLPDYAEKDGRVHGSFNQTGTATGRFSSSSPNLQNQPAKEFAPGKHVRNLYVAPEGYLLLRTDYSQIEYRLLAHMSGDKALIKAFKSGRDFHQEIADMVHCERKDAKALNFGKIYGMSTWAFAASANIDISEADAFYGEYAKLFPMVDPWIARVHHYVQHYGYVRTFSGRRRLLPDIASSEIGIRNAAKRQAVNTVIQGSAADIIKMAMAEIYYRLCRYNEKDIRMVLTVHDELVFEVRKKVATRYLNKVRAIQENVVPLRVPITVGIALGNTWLEAKDD